MLDFGRSKIQLSCLEPIALTLDMELAYSPGTIIHIMLIYESLLTIQSLLFQ